MTASPLRPADIDATFVPEFREEVVAVAVGDESVIYEEDTGVLHQLDAIATVVCDHFDGDRSVGMVADELSAVFAADRAVIEADIVAMVQDLGRKGLFHGVEGPEPVDGEV